MMLDELVNHRKPQALEIMDMLNHSSRECNTPSRLSNAMHDNYTRHALYKCDLNWLGRRRSLLDIPTTLF